MGMSWGANGIELFSTCPPSSGFSQGTYLDRVAEVSRWSDEAGCQGMLIYTDNSLVDPWLVAQMVLQSTTALCPLVAVQPVYMHPYSVAKMVASLAHLHERRIWLNMVAGGFRGDLLALGDDTEHDARYDRLVEFTTIVKELLAGSVVTFEGKYYRVRNLSLKPRVPDELLPGWTVSGSSPAGLAAARAIQATAVKYPKPPGEEVDQRADTVRTGVRVGVIARETSSEAWRVGFERFPEDRKGQITHALAMKVTDSQWHGQLSDLGETQLSERNPYWLGPFENYKTFCPYLVGSYESVGAELGRYLGLGFTTFIVDVPTEPDDFVHTAAAFAHAAQARPRVTPPEPSVSVGD
jgi:alkanesulfonate monooxygenase